MRCEEHEFQLELTLEIEKLKLEDDGSRTDKIIIVVMNAPHALLLEITS